MRGCDAKGCSGTHEARGLCNRHYLRMKNSGRIDLPNSDERFWAKVKKTETCWIWTGAKSGTGYGNVNINGKYISAHRYSFELLVGPISDGLDLDHKCHNTACVRPDHLHAVDRGTNCENRSSAQANSATGIRGVSWDTKTNKWLAQASRRGVRHVAGYFSDIKDAEAAAVALRNQLFTNNITDRKAA